MAAHAARDVGFYWIISNTTAGPFVLQTDVGANQVLAAAFACVNSPHVVLPSFFELIYRCSPVHMGQVNTHVHVSQASWTCELLVKNTYTLSADLSF